MIHRIRERRAFERLAREGTRIRRSALWCRCCSDPEAGATCVAYAIGRAHGNAVARNRLRRRLRAIVSEYDRERPLPAALLLIGGRPQLVELAFDQLRSEVRALLDEVSRVCGAGC